MLCSGRHEVFLVLSVEHALLGNVRKEEVRLQFGRTQNGIVKKKDLYSQGSCSKSEPFVTGPGKHSPVGFIPQIRSYHGIKMSYLCILWGLIYGGQQRARETWKD